MIRLINIRYAFAIVALIPVSANADIAACTPTSYSSKIPPTLIRPSRTPRARLAGSLWESRKATDVLQTARTLGYYSSIITSYPPPATRQLRTQTYPSNNKLIFGLSKSETLIRVDLTKHY